MAERDPETGRFLPGNSGFSGRPKGSRNKLGESFLQDLQTAWEEQGPEVIQAVIQDRPQDFLKVVASILPKEMNLNVNDERELTDEQIVSRLRTLDAAMRPFLDIDGPVTH